MVKKLLTLLFVSVLTLPLSTAVFGKILLPKRKPQRRAAARVLSQEAIRTSLR